MNQRFISCDWGTSALRMHLVERPDDRPVAGVESAEGIGTVHRAWLNQGAVATEREAFYLNVARRQVERLAESAGYSLHGLPVVMSGMATATVGLRDVPYKELPFSLQGGDLSVTAVPATDGFPHPLVLISGARGPDDVMRGEETQLVGAATLEPAMAANGLAILPGTHSKHIEISAGRVTRLATYMTGEFFDLLAHRSILANSVEDAGGAGEGGGAFVDGVRRGAEENLLRASFGVRVAQIFGARSRVESRHFLSGLVIGAELTVLRPRASTGVALTLIGSPGLMERYAAALKALEWSGPIRKVAGDRAAIAGQRVIARHAGLLAIS